MDFPEKHGDLTGCAKHKVTTPESRGAGMITGCVTVYLPL
jgi:hypothetical protein